MPGMGSTGMVRIPASASTDCGLHIITHRAAQGAWVSSSGFVYVVAITSRLSGTCCLPAPVRY
uniref:Uncharacterized protein n=1 Tax=Anguilla anguilla TaxID=7936 RepID=A0A0E9TJ74_ANGAN